MVMEPPKKHVKLIECDALLSEEEDVRERSQYTWLWQDMIDGAVDHLIDGRLRFRNLPMMSPFAG